MVPCSAAKQGVLGERQVRAPVSMSVVPDNLVPPLLLPWELKKRIELALSFLVLKQGK